jgi:hypothetical protein
MGLKYHKCPTFDGQADTFLAWYLKFSGFAYHQGFKRAISTEIDPRMPLREDSPRSSDPTTADEERGGGGHGREQCWVRPFDLLFDCES